MVEVQYRDLFEFITYSESTYDFLQRLSISTSVVMFELSERIGEEQFPYKVVPIIDEMNKEINSLVSNLNSINLVSCQPELQENLLIRLIEATNPILYRDYVYAKYVLPN
jgi:hypothetical protein